jgi:hypothetical protein
VRNFILVKLGIVLFHKNEHELIPIDRILKVSPCKDIKMCAIYLHSPEDFILCGETVQEVHEKIYNSQSRL